MKKSRIFTVLMIFGLVFSLIAGMSGQTSAAESSAQPDAVIYAIDDWAKEFISIPDAYPVSYQIDTQNDEDASFYIVNGDSCVVSETGLVTPNILTYYWYDMGSWNVGTTVPKEDMEYFKITQEVQYGETRIRAYVNGKYTYYTVDVENYAPVYADEVIDKYVAENFTDDMTTEELLDAICRYPASFNYDAQYSGATGMVISGGGDCWASTSLILEVCERLGIQAKARNGNRDPGAGSGHMNALVTIADGEYYELEAGYAGTAPRYYSVTRRTSLFCFKSTTGGLEVYQYDGDLTADSVLQIPSTFNSKPVVSIGESFVSGKAMKEVVIPDTVTGIGKSAFNSCSNLQTLHIPASVTSIGNFAFTACTSLKNFTCSSDNPAYVIEDGVLYDKARTTVISVPAASSLDLPSTVHTIGSYAIYYNDNIKYIDLPESVKTVEEGGISGCRNLKLLILRGVETLSDFAFAQIGSGGKVYFMGDAPAMAASVFYRATVTALYPEGNATWTAAVMDSVQEYGTVTWAATSGILEITSQPADTSAADGKVAKTSVEALGDGLTYQWYVAAPGKTTFTKSSNTTATYSCKMSQANDGRQVYCVITDKHGSTVTSDVATLHCLSITEQPADSSAAVGEKVTTSVTASGSGLQYTWYIKDPGSSKFAKSSVTTPTYSYKMTAAKSGRQVYCVITDQYGTSVTSRTAVLGAAVSVTEQPVDAAAKDGAVVKTTVTASGIDLTYQWYVAAPGKTKFTKSSNTTAAYACKMSEANDGRRVYCVITDGFGNTVTTKTVTLRMTKTAKITSQPADGFAKLGQKVKTTVTATGDGLQYAWYIKDPGSSKFTKSSVTAASYSYTMTAAKSGRQVYCVVTDQYGNSVTTRTAVLSAAASITKQPVDAAASDGAVVKTTVTAFGTDLTYQWYVAAPGSSKFTKSSNTTATYACKMSQANDGRRVYCVITDSYGNTVKSNTVTLTLK